MDAVFLARVKIRLPSGENARRIQYACRDLARARCLVLSVRLLTIDVRYSAMLSVRSVADLFCISYTLR